ncbi:hypothetical protein LZ32DRAFT_662633 [Colletotrichum eremochloae]|nr:hypothetical protein LZ32DRAFT_662633 [Colletotrichum eremochloae]
MVSTSIIRLAASATILAGVNGQGITLTRTAFETVHISRFSSVTVTVDQPITTIPSTTSVGMIPVIITTTMTIMVPVRETISILPTFTSPDSNAIVTPVPTVPIVDFPSMITTTTCNFNGTCRAITVPAPWPIMVTTLTDCYNSTCRPVTTITYPVAPEVFTLTRCDFNGTCSVVTRTNVPVVTSIPLLSTSSGRSTGIRSNTTRGSSSSIRTGTPTFSVTRGPTLVTRTSFNTTIGSSSPPATLSSRPVTSSSRSLSTPQQPSSRPSSDTPSPPSATTRPVLTSPTVVVVAGEPPLKPFRAIPLMGLLGAVAAGMALM